MSKKDYHEKNKTEEYYKDVILNILKTFIKELIKQFTKKLPENNPLIKDKKTKNERVSKRI